MHRGRFLVLTKQGGWLTPPLTPVHKNTVRNGKSERISNLKERVRIILVWCGRQELNLHGCPPVPKTGVSAIPPRPRIHIIVIKTGKRRTRSGIHYSILITTSQLNVTVLMYILRYFSQINLMFNEGIFVQRCTW